MNNYIFIHIPKCGGTSLKKGLGEDHHGHECGWCLHNRMPTSVWKNSYKFAIIRNPYSRISSFYKYLSGKDGYGIKEDNLNFEDWFYLTIVEQEKPYCYKKFFFAPCWDWLAIDNSLDHMDDIFKLEEIDQHSSHIAKMVNYDFSMPHLNKTNGQVLTYTTAMKDIMQAEFKKDFETWYNV